MHHNLDTHTPADGPPVGSSWLCFRCARHAHGSLPANWATTQGPARLATGDRLFLAAPQEPQPAYDLFYRASVEEATSGQVRAFWVDFERDSTNPEWLPVDSYRIWHGTLDESLWEDMQEFAFAPFSRRLFPDSFATIAATHGLSPPRINVGHIHGAGGANATAPGRSRKRSRSRSPVKSPMRAAAAPAERNDGTAAAAAAAASSAGVGGAQHNSETPTATPVASPSALPANAAELTGTSKIYQGAADAWVAAVRKYGDQVGDPVLARMPAMLAFKRDMAVHPYALWLVILVRSLPTRWDIHMAVVLSRRTLSTLPLQPCSMLAHLSIDAFYTAAFSFAAIWPAPDAGKASAPDICSMLQGAIPCHGHRSGAAQQRSPLQSSGRAAPSRLAPPRR